MSNENIEIMKADAKKAMADLENIMHHAKAEVEADVEKVKARFGHDDELGKKAAYAKADIKADAENAKSDLDNKLAHEKADEKKVEFKVKIET